MITTEKGQEIMTFILATVVALICVCFGVLAVSGTIFLILHMGW